MRSPTGSLAPEKIGKYEIAQEIGSGGFGIVYEGRDPFLKRRVAVKTCTSGQSDIRERFFREAEIAGNLHHRNITTVHDFGLYNEIPYLVQEFLTGEDLDHKIFRQEIIPATVKIDYLLQIARGLEYAHQRGVIHRDVKPGNIRVLADGTIKIMDFGIAKLANVESNLTQTGMTLGTAAYLSPEQIRGLPLDHRSDIFSFGVLAYELLTLERPFDGKTISALFFKILQKSPVPIIESWLGCPPRLQGVVFRCLAKNREDRYSSLRDVIEELSRILRQARSESRQISLQKSLEDTPVDPEIKKVLERLSKKVEGALEAGEAESAEELIHAAREMGGRTALFLRLFDPLIDRLKGVPRAKDLTTQTRQIVQEVRSALDGGELDGAEERMAALKLRNPELPELKELRAEWEQKVASRELNRAVEAAKLEISSLIDSRRLDDALERVKSAIRTLGSHPPLVELRSRIYRRLDDLDSTTRRNRLESAKREIRGFLAQEDLCAAAERLHEVLPDSDGDEEISQLETALHEKRKGRLGDQTSELIRETSELATKGLLDEALEVVEATLAHTPESMDMHRIQQLRQELSASQKDDQARDQAEAAAGKIRALIRTDHLVMAKAALDAAIRKQGDHRILYDLAEEIENAKAEKNKVSQSPSPPPIQDSRQRARDSQLSKAKFCYQHRRFREAIGLLEEILSLQPDYAPAASLLREVKFKLEASQDPSASQVEATANVAQYLLSEKDPEPQVAAKHRPRHSPPPQAQISAEPPAPRFTHSVPTRPSSPPLPLGLILVWGAVIFLLILLVLLVFF